MDWLRGGVVGLLILALSGNLQRQVGATLVELQHARDRRLDELRLREDARTTLVPEIRAQLSRNLDLGMFVQTLRFTWLDSRLQQAVLAFIAASESAHLSSEQLTQRLLAPQSQSPRSGIPADVDSVIRCAAEEAVARGVWTIDVDAARVPLKARGLSPPTANNDPFAGASAYLGRCTGPEVGEIIIATKANSAAQSVAAAAHAALRELLQKSASESPYQTQAS